MQINKTKTGAALIALILASAGGAAFLHKNPNPALRDVFGACETGSLHGIVCCEDMMHVTKAGDSLENQCGMVRPGFPDPLGYRKFEEDRYDAKVKQELEQ